MDGASKVNVNQPKVRDMMFHSESWVIFPHYCFKGSGPTLSKIPVLVKLQFAIRVLEHHSTYVYFTPKKVSSSRSLWIKFNRKATVPSRWFPLCSQ